MKLPRSLAPWAQQLKIFPEEISPAIGAMAQKIAAFVSPLRSLEEVSDREPNGYDGVTGRGIYERLLLSELALADEVPEEFIRRAVMGEHLFLNLARVAPSAKRTSVVLFDAGAEQLGTPRIAHLAALIVLARRAEAAKAVFAWGVLQDKEFVTFAEVTESNVLNLLEARTAQNVNSEQLKQWREKLAEQEAVADVWLVGSDDLKTFEESKGFSVLSVEDVLEPRARQLQVSVKPASGAERQTVLELPEESICTRLLRNPFEVHKQPEKVSLAGNLSSFFFDDNGGKIFARGDAKSVLYIGVPNSPNAEIGNPRRYRLTNENEILLAAGRLGKSIATLSLTEAGHLRLDYPKHGNFQLPVGNYSLDGAEFFLPDDNHTLFPIYNVRFPNSPFFQAAVKDAKNNLFLLNKADDIGKDLVGRAFLTATNVLAAARLENRFVFVGFETATKAAQIVSYGEQTQKRQLPFANAAQAFFGRGIYLASKNFGLLALGDAENHFAIITEGGDRYTDASPESTVVGVFFDSSFSPEVGLVELEDNRRTLNFNVGRKYNKQIFISDEEIVKIVFSHRSPVFAYKTVSGKVVIFSLTHRVPIGTIGG
jgi:hypothetical protein